YISNIVGSGWSGRPARSNSTPAFSLGMTATNCSASSSAARDLRMTSPGSIGGSAARMSDCSLEMGTGRPLDLLGKPPSLHVALDSELPCDGQNLLDRWIVVFFDVPERTGTEFCERAAVEPDHVLPRGLVPYPRPLSSIMIGHGVGRLTELPSD